MAHFSHSLKTLYIYSIQEIFFILNLGIACIIGIFHMILHDHHTTTIRILLVLIEFFLIWRTLSSGFWKSFNFQGQVHFHNRQIHHERFNSLLVITPIKFHDGKELRKAQSRRINKRAMSRTHVKERHANCSILWLTK